MDWGNDYFTFSDTNIEYIWRFLQARPRARAGSTWATARRSGARAAARRSRSTSSRSRASTRTAPTRRSSSASRSSTGRGESLVVWTTTPWTLPANVAAAVNPDAEYGRRDERRVGRRSRATRTRRSSSGVRGAELVGLRYEGPFDELGPGAPRSSTASSRGTRSRSRRAPGIVHIAPGCGAEDFELSQASHDLPVLTPVDEAGRFYDDYGWLHGLSTVEAADQIVGDLGERGLLVEAGLYEHRYPHCWRCDTPLIFRISDDWFIAVDELRPQLLEANATVEWTPAYMGKRMDDWLRNMGDWNISRRRYYGLPLPVLPLRVRAPERDRLEGRAARSAPSSGLDQLEELRRPVDRRRADPLRGVRRGGAPRSPRSATSGSTPASSPSRRSAGRTRSGSREGYATGAARGPDDGRPARPRVLGAVVPGRLGLGDARADPALVLLAALHVGRRSSGARRSGRCSATRRCSTSAAARCTARGGT